MKQLTCIIVDDEPLARKGVSLNVKEISWLENAGEFPNAIKANDFLKNNSVDIMFLDIEMPGLNGLDFLRSLKFDGVVILTTAYPQFALDAFELDVLDYLTKPIQFDRFFKAVNRAREVLELKNKSEGVAAEMTDDFFYIRSDRKYVKLYYENVLWIKGLKDYVMLFTKKEKYMTALNIKTINAQLPDSIFARVSKSYIINVNEIEAIDVDTILIGEESIPLGNSYKEDFLAKHVKGKLFKR